MELHNILDKNKDTYLYLNRTARYLAPSLVLYGQEFMQHFVQLKVLSYGLDDRSLQQDEGYTRPIFILCQSNRAFIENIKWISEHESYVHHYPFGEVLSTGYVMLVLNLEESMEDTYKDFSLGKYSDMYSNLEDMLPEIFRKNETNALDVVTTTKAGRDHFKDVLEREFGTKVSDEDIEGAELDLPAKPEEEIYNYHLKFHHNA